MNDERITRLPPGAGTTQPAQAVAGVRRDKDRRDDTPNDPDAENAKPADPVDEIVLSADAPAGFADPNMPDAYEILLSAVRELVEQHRADYLPADYLALTEQIAILESHAVKRLYWPPQQTLQDALAAACASFAQTTG